MITFKTCKIEGCVKKACGRGYCSAHYSKLLKYGDPLAGKTNRGGDCAIDGCNSPVKAHGLCSKHYDRARKHGDPTCARPVVMCVIDGCFEKQKGHGLCEFHYDRKRRFGDPLGGGERRLSPKSLGKCKVDGCEKQAIAKHLCSAHNSKLKKYGDPLAGYVQDGRSREWRVNKLGYVEKFDRSSPHAAKNGFVFQHRQVMGEYIGRPLRKDENVHHKNGDRSDNRIENLELWSKSQPAGQRVVDKVRWAREILADYGHLGL